MTSSEIETALTTATRAIESTVERYQPEPVALSYSGGIESSLLMHLAEPWRASITVYTALTGAEFRHALEFIKRKLAPWKHRIITTDLSASFRNLGFPASVVPVEHTRTYEIGGNGTTRSPVITDWWSCCAANRSTPLNEAVCKDGIHAAVHGQRWRDFPTHSPRPPLTHYPQFEMVAPLWDMTRAQVHEAVRDLKIELPEHYSEIDSSLSCSVCPAYLTTPRRAWMAKHYPDDLAGAEKIHASVSEAVVAALDADNTENAHHE